MVQALTVVFLRVFAAYVIFNTLMSIPNWLNAAMSELYRGELGATLNQTFLLLITITLAAGVAVWRLAPKIARWILPAMEGPMEAPSTVGGEDLIAAGTFLIGTYWAFGILPDLVPSLILFTGGEPDGFGNRPMISVTHLASAVAQLVIGLGMMFGSVRLGRLFMRLRTAGQNG